MGGEPYGEEHAPHHEEQFSRLRQTEPEDHDRHECDRRDRAQDVEQRRQQTRNDGKLTGHDSQEDPERRPNHEAGRHPIDAGRQVQEKLSAAHPFENGDRDHGWRRKQHDVDDAGARDQLPKQDKQRDGKRTDQDVEPLQAAGIGALASTFAAFVGLQSCVRHHGRRSYFDETVTRAGSRLFNGSATITLLKSGIAAPGG